MPAFNPKKNHDQRTIFRISGRTSAFELCFNTGEFIFSHIKAFVMTTEIVTTKLVTLSGRKKISQARLLLMACLLGVVMGVLFILVQPLLGMDTLTSRHAAMYQKLGGWNAMPALVIAWFIHLAVSVLYGLLSGFVVLKARRLAFVALVIVAFSWVTTVIAPPANAVIVQLVSFQHIESGNLPGLNFNFDEKFVLHLLFFAVIAGALHVYKRSKQNL